MKFLIAVNLSPRWVLVLIAAGYEAAHWTRVGPSNSPDSSIMAFAEAHGFIVITNDLDFGEILAATGRLKPSIVQIRAASLSPDRIGVRVLSALSRMALELEEGALLSIDTKRDRLRVLPIRIH